jgi:glycosyltransferase involved in cell wall biosynthesis
MSQKFYVLVTTARNEESTIEITIRSVLYQTLQPREWVIVSDGSTDRTDQIVSGYGRDYSFIRLLRLNNRPARNFASVVFALENGCRMLKCLDYDYLGLLDADVRLPINYYEQILLRFNSEPSLGMAGGVAVDIGTTDGRCPKNLNDIPGAVQFFRRECFDSLRPLIAIPEGGWDALTCAMARMKGYGTRLLPELVVDHLKPRNSSQGNSLRRKWQLGIRDHALGYHPLFELLKCIGRMSEHPRIIGAIAWYMGFLSETLCGRVSLLPSEFRTFIRHEQMQRIRSSLRKHPRNKSLR